MNYEQARQRQSDGRWDWTTMNDGRVWPVGYCNAFPTKAEGIEIPGWDQWIAGEERFREKYHGRGGHETREEAERCHWAYRLDHMRESEFVQSGKTIQLCARCDEPATRQFTDQYSVTATCADHATRETLEDMHPFRAGTVVMHS